MIKTSYKLIRTFLRAMRDNNTSSFAAGAAYFVFLSAIPIVLLVCSILPYTRLSREYVAGLLLSLLPGNIAALFDGILLEFEERSVAVISVAAVSTLWISGKGLFALINGLNAVNHFPERRNWFILRLRASIYTVFFIILMLVSFLILVFGNFLNELLIRYIPHFSILLSLILRFRFLFVWAVFTLFFQILYTVLPSGRMIYKRQFPGALFASVGWSIFSWGFSVYLEYFDAYSLYGSIAAVVIGLVWLYFCMYILLIGAQINIFFEPIFVALAQFSLRRREERSARRRQRLGSSS